MDYTQTEQIDQYLQAVLKPSRYRHSLGVVEMAESLARIWGADLIKTRFAALTHDIAKCHSVEEMNRLCRMYGVSEQYWNDPALAHSKVGAAMLKQDFGVDDEDILMAVSSHTTGRVGMTLLEEIIYVSDAIEPNRSYPGLEELQKLAAKDLDAACLEIMDFCIDLIQSKGKTLDRETVDAREFIREKIRSKK